eukprot:Opistho-2@63259
MITLPKIFTCIIVDDEQDNIELLTHYISEIPYLFLKATFDKPSEALVYLLKSPPDLLITDINMPQLSGIDPYKSIYTEVSTQVIFMSGYPDRIIEAIQYSVIDYLQKPVSSKRFELATQKAFNLSENHGRNNLIVPLAVLNKALKNYPQLSTSEKKIVELLSQGKTTQIIAELLFVSKKTVEAHRYN